MDLWTLFLSLAGAVLVYLALHKMKSLYRFFREYYVLWNIAVGARGDRRAINTAARLHAYMCDTNLLDEISVNQIYTFFKEMIDTDASVEQFHRVLLSYNYVVLCRERIDGSLRGAELLGVDRKEQGGRKYTFIRCGLTFVQRHYQGGPLLHYAMLYLIIKELLLHPRTPLYLIGKSYSYKSYLVMSKALKRFHPRYDEKPPVFEQELIDNFAKEVSMKGDVYDPKRCVIERTLSNMKDFVAPLTERELENPHIKFFHETNPGWQRGHQLITLGKVTWTDLFTYIFTVAPTRANYRHGNLKRHDNLKRNAQTKRRLQRGLSFQSEDAQRYVLNHSDSLLKMSEVVQKEDERPDYARQSSCKVFVPL